MQPLKWYARRLGAMSPAEVFERLRAGLRDLSDVPARRARMRGARRHARRALPGTLGGLVVPSSGPLSELWVERLLERAGPLVRGRHRVFDVEDLWLGDPIDWNRDPKHGVAAPRQFAGFIDYRDFRVTGDAKFVWEPNRHHHLVVLGRAYRATGDATYARAVAEQLRQWLDQCPFGIGMNWRSPLELAVRLINWVWALELIREARVLDLELHERLMAAAYLHLWDISRKYSRGSSANNHRIGEAAGVYIGSSYFAGFPAARQWRAESQQILTEEIETQTHADGGTREQAVGYQFFVTQFSLLAGILARRCGRDFPLSYWERLRRMCVFLAALGEAGPPPLFGDCDDGYVLDLDADPHDMRPWLGTAALLLDERELKGAAGELPEAAVWLLGAQARVRYAALALPAAAELRSRAFPGCGYYLLQAGRRGAADAVSVVFDCGPLGMGPLAAHGHADALSFTLRVGGHDVLVDPGTYDYFTYPAWRDYFRSTQAHNTVVIDGLNQSVILGPFLWGRAAQSRCLEWSPNQQGGRVVGQHDGYTRLADPVMHRRTLELDARRRELRINDEVRARTVHESTVCFHFAEQAQLAKREGSRFLIELPAARLELVLDDRLTVEVWRGSEQPIAGWVSRGYHRKAAALTLKGRCVHNGSLTLATRLTWSVPATNGGE